MVLGLGDGAGGEEGGGVGGGGGDGGGERRWMIANILPACYMQISNISKIKYEVEGRQIIT